MGVAANAKEPKERSSRECGNIYSKKQNRNTNMKTVFGSLISCAAAAAVLAVTGCHSISVQSRPNVGVAAYPPTDPASVQILRQAPTQPNIKLGEITAEPSSTSTPVADIETKLREAGAKMGANAVVIVEDRTAIMGATVTGGWYDRQLSPDIGQVVVGVPIRFTGPAAAGGAQMP
jgi:hypothetical protein